MSTWFEGNSEIACSIQSVKVAIENHGALYVGVVGHMPSLTSVELVEENSDSVTIKTNEGLMKRTGISKLVEAERVVVEFDEEYQAGRMITAKSHYLDEFTTMDAGVTHRTVISNVEAPGLLGFFYRAFGGSSIGKSCLASYKSYFESLS